MKGKYVIGLALDDPNFRRLEAILFSESMVHKEAATLFGFGEYVVSAGFFELSIATDSKKPSVTVFGESETLGVGGSEFDKFYVERALGLDPQGPMLDRVRRVKDYDEALAIIRAREKKKK